MSEEEGYIVEFVAVGSSVKVTAVDPETMREVSIIGPKNIPPKELAQLAVRKLRYVLERDGEA